VSAINGDEARERPGGSEGEASFGPAQQAPESAPAAPGFDPPTVELGSPQAPAGEHAQEQRGYEGDMSAPAESWASEQGPPQQDSPPQPQGPPEQESVPTQDPVASNGAGPTDQLGESGSYAEDVWWQRPEAAVGAAFVGGLLLAALLKRRRS
jgi:hypothetical protein